MWDWIIWLAAIIVAVSIVTVLANLFIIGRKYENLDTRAPKYRRQK